LPRAAVSDRLRLMAASSSSIGCALMQVSGLRRARGGEGGRSRTAGCGSVGARSLRWHRPPRRGSPVARRRIDSDPLILARTRPRQRSPGRDPKADERESSIGKRLVAWQACRLSLRSSGTSASHSKGLLTTFSKKPLDLSELKA
jgi:hypothetical protein